MVYRWELAVAGMVNVAVKDEASMPARYGERRQLGVLGICAHGACVCSEENQSGEMNVHART